MLSYKMLSLKEEILAIKKVNKKKKLQKIYLYPITLYLYSKTYMISSSYKVKCCVLQIANDFLSNSS